MNLIRQRKIELKVTYSDYSPQTSKSLRPECRGVSVTEIWKGQIGNGE
jgi:hypothetical protein